LLSQKEVNYVKGYVVVEGSKLRFSSIILSITYMPEAIEHKKIAREITCNQPSRSTKYKKYLRGKDCNMWKANYC
jgi:hypothetical protein